MGAFDWLFGKDDGQAQADFDHPKVYDEVDTGPGVAAMSQAAASWREKVSTAFSDADAALARVLKDADVLMRGASGDQAKDSVTPLSRATQESIEVAAQAGDAVQQQAQASADFKNQFPPPHQVPPSNMGFGDYANPVAFGYKTGVRMGHEKAHDETEKQARQQYETYTQNSNQRVGAIHRFDPPPKFAGDVSSAASGSGQQVATATGVSAGNGTGTPTGQSAMPSVDATSPESGANTAASAPAESGSASAALPTTGTAAAAPAAGSPAGAPAPSPASGPGVPGASPAPGPGGVFGGVSIPPGGAGGGSGAPGRGGVPGGAPVRGGAPGSGNGGGNAGGNSRVPTGGRLPGGGYSGVGNPATPGGNASTAGSSSARPGQAGVGGTAATGRGQRDEEDQEHTNKYLQPTNEAWEDLDLPKVAPPVLGDWARDGDAPPGPPGRG